MSSDESANVIYRIITPVLTFAVGALGGVIYGWIVASQKWNEEMDKVRESMQRMERDQLKTLREDDYGR